MNKIKKKKGKEERTIYINFFFFIDIINISIY